MAWFLITLANVDPDLCGSFFIISSWKTRLLLSYKVNKMAAPGLVMQGARASAVIVLTYHQVSNIRPTLVSNKIVDHSDVVGASPVGAAPTTSSFST